MLQDFCVRENMMSLTHCFHTLLIVGGSVLGIHFVLNERESARIFSWIVVGAEGRRFELEPYPSPYAQWMEKSNSKVPKWLYRVIHKYFYKFSGCFSQKRRRKKTCVANADQFHDLHILSTSVFGFSSGGPPKTTGLCYMPSSEMSKV